MKSVLYVLLMNKYSFDSLYYVVMCNSLESIKVAGSKFKLVFFQPVASSRAYLIRSDGGWAGVIPPYFTFLY